MEARVKNQKLLGDFLLEQQDPFVLEVFLLERGCSRGFLNGSFKRSSSSKRRKGVINLSKFLRALHNQIAFFNGSFTGGKHKNGRDRGRNSSVSENSSSITREGAEGDGLSSRSSTTVYISCTESDTEENPKSQEQHGLESHIPDRIQEYEHFAYSFEKKRPTPLPPSIEEQLHSSWKHSGSEQEMIPSRKVDSPTKMMEDCSVSASLLEVLLQCLKDKEGYSKVSELNQQITWCEYSSSKKGSRQMKQLLFDCFTEVTETQERKQRAKGHGKVALGAEETGKLVCDKIMKWGRTSRSGTSITELLYVDFLDSLEEWGDCLPQKTEISSGIADAILEEIRDEISAEMVSVQQPDRNG